MKFWCSEDTISILFMSYLKNRGFSLILGTNPNEIHVHFSKSNLVKGGAKLSNMALQGRNFVDISAYKDDLMMLGLVISRMYVIAYANGPEHLTKVIDLFISTPSRSETTYSELKKMGYNITSTNIAKLYKILIAARGVGRLRRVYDASKSLHMVLLIPCIVNKDIVSYISRRIDELCKYMVEEHDEKRELTYTVLCFKPSEFSKIAPPYVIIQKLVSSKNEIFEDSFKIPFLEIMGYEYLGCSKCKYISTCMKYMGL